MRLRDLKPLANLTQLTHINLAYCTDIDDVSPLANLTQLKFLKLQFCGEVKGLHLLQSLKGIHIEK